MPFRLSHWLTELRRRKVFRVGAVYAAVGIGVIEGAPCLTMTRCRRGVDDRGESRG